MIRKILLLKIFFIISIIVFPKFNNANEILLYADNISYDEDENIILLVAILENNKKFSAKLFINELMEKDDQSHLQIVEESAMSYGAISSSVLAVMDNISEEEEGIEKKYVKCLGRVGEETAIEIKILEEEVQRGIKASEFLNSQF